MENSGESGDDGGPLGTTTFLGGSGIAGNYIGGDIEGMKNILLCKKSTSIQFKYNQKLSNKNYKTQYQQQISSTFSLFCIVSLIKSFIMYCTILNFKLKVLINSNDLRKKFF